MTDFKIGDRVKVISDDRIGRIVAMGNQPTATIGKVVPGKELEPEMSICWWKVRLDETGKEEDFPNDGLEKLL